MVVRAAHENSGLLDSDGADELEILLVGADPRRNLGKFKPQSHAFLQSLTVLLGVHEELRLANHALRAAQLVQELVDVHHLLCGVGCAGLLSVAEGRVGDEDVLGHIFRDATIVKRNLGRFGVREHLPEQLRFRRVLQLIDVGILFQFERFVAELQIPHDVFLRAFRNVLYKF